ncbi:MAG: DUF6603 domain-containing protein [Rhodothermales bacterium]|nr:DUF6603 domain-containing protein [Rhodothermales bacterium]
MTEPQDTFQRIAGELILAVDPLREAFRDLARFQALMYKLGWLADAIPDSYLELASAIEEAVGQVEDLAEGEPTLEEILTLVATAKDLYDRIQNLSEAPPGVDAGAFLAEIGERLFECLFVEYLNRRLIALSGVLSALDVVSVEHIPASGPKGPHIRTQFHWDRIPDLLTDPVTILQGVTGWGTDAPNYALLFGPLANLFYGLGFSVEFQKVDETLSLAYSGLPHLPTLVPMPGLKIPLYYNEIGGVPIELSVEFQALPAAGGKLPGIVIQPSIPSLIPLQYELGNEVSLEIRAGTDIGATFGMLICPGAFDVKYPFQDGTFPSAGFGFTVDFHPAEPLLLFGSPGGLRLEWKGGTVGGEAQFVSGELEVLLKLGMKELTLVLTAGEGDGFLQNILGDAEKRIGIPLGVTWSNKHGFGFEGSMNFELSFNPHIDLGFIQIPEFRLTLGLPVGADNQLKLEAGVNITGLLGPITFVVEQIGIGVYAAFEPGNLGPLDLSLGFKPPNGVGLAIDAGVVKGGGYLYFDFEKEEYAGALELEFSGFLTLKAIALITTRMPDGSSGFSLLIVITAEFGTGLQLGFGFTLLGVGGILGLNRRMNLDPLVEGVRTGAIESVLFPEDVIANAPRIISDLQAFFPVEEGIFVIGPMAKLGWGTPTLISLTLGVIFEIPGNIAILGVLKVALPDEEFALVQLQVNFIGAIEFDKERAYFFAGLFESRILFMTIEGELGVLVAWGSDANFVVSVGGFHPSFTPPPLPFPTPKRISVDILNESYGRIGVTAYFAVTSNTVQLGANAELFFGFSDFKVEGWIGFDALFQFNPFYFIVEISGGVSLRVFGVGLWSISLRFTLEGTSPWRAKGYGELSLLFFSIKVNFDYTWGEAENTALPPIQVMALIAGELDKLDNWTAVVPAANNLLVALRPLPVDNEALVLHPVGTLKVSQRAVPLGLTLNKIGSQKPSDVDFVTVEVLGGLAKVADVEESFAIAQFQDFKDAEKLSKPPFQSEDAGLELAAADQAYKTGKITERNVRYETVIIDTNYQRYVVPFFGFLASLFTLFLHGNATTKSALSNHRKTQLQPFTDRIVVGAEAYGVAFNSTNAAFDGQAVFTSEAKAREYMNHAVAGNPALADELHVIPHFELSMAA